jgi:hypothetical protein
VIATTSRPDSRSYLFYFASNTLEWYAEWQIDLGAPATTPANVDALAWPTRARSYSSSAADPVLIMLPLTFDDPSGTDPSVS